MLQADQLSYQRSERRLWQDIQFELAPGKLLQITGPNGCGKTSLLRVLTGLAPASTGAVYWQGRSICQQKMAYQQQMHYLGHQPAIKGELTVRENLQFNLAKVSAQSWLTAIAQVGLAEHINHWGYQLSQGEKQRVALARLLQSGALLWILDEPLAGLDAGMIETLQLIFANHLQQGGMIVLTTHRPLTLAPLSHSQQLELQRSI